MYRLDPGGFPAQALEVLGGGPDLPGAQFLVATLASEPDWLRTVCDPEKHTLEQSLYLIHRAHKLDRLTEMKLAEMLAHSGMSTDAEARFASRVFAVLKQSEPSASLPALRQLSKCANARVRSKAVLMIGKIYQNPRLSHHAELEQDPRVAANAVESLWGLATSEAREAFVKATIDPRHRIAANGIVGLYLMGDDCSIPLLFRLSLSEMPMARAAAAWAMGEVEDPRFLQRLASLRQDPDAITRQRAFRAMARVRQKMVLMQAVGALQVQIQSCECRGHALRTRFSVSRQEESVKGLDARQIVVWNGPDVVEEFFLTSHQEAPPYYEIECLGPPLPANRVKVQVYAESGVAEGEEFEVTLL
jgi:hypothetical protein